MEECPASDILEQLVRDELAEDEKARVARHVATCPQCQSVAEQHRDDLLYVDGFRDADTDDPVVATEHPADEQPDHASESLGPEFIPGYETIREIGRGGQAVVYEAAQHSTKGRVALKVLHGGRWASEKARRRFEREIETAVMLRHPNIVTIHDAGLTRDACYCSMELIEGEPLNIHVKRKRLDRRARLTMFSKICAAVNHAHQHGVIHCDLKPSNILVDSRDEPHIVDFGVAKALSDETGRVHGETITETGHVFGTAAYLSPEQALGTPRDVDVRSDAYALGVILYRLLTDRFPYDVQGPLIKVFANIASREPLPPSRTGRRIEADLERIVLKALSKDREHRYQTAGDLARDIGHFLAGEPIEARGDSGFYVLRKLVWRHRVAASVAAAFMAVLVGATLISVQAKNQAQWHAYLAAIGAANRSLEDNDVVGMRKWLGTVPQKFHHNWEYGYLRSQTDGSIRTIGKEGNPPVKGVAISPDGAWIAYGGSDHNVYVHDLYTQCLRYPPLSVHHDMVRCVCISNDGLLIASGSNDSTVALWDAAGGRLVDVFSTGFKLEVKIVAFNEDATLIAAGYNYPAFSDGCIAVWDVATGELVAEIRKEPSGPVEGLEFLDGDRLLACNENNRIRMWDIQNWNLVRRVDGPDRGDWACCALAPDRQMFITGDERGGLSILNLDSERPVITHQSHTLEVTSVAWDPCGERFVTASIDHTACVWAVDQARMTVRLERAFLGHTRAIRSVALGLKGSVCATGSDDGTVKLWCVQNRDSLSTGQDYLNGFAISPNGKVVASVGHCDSALLWDMDTHERLGSLGPHRSWVNCVAFSPDGRWIATGTRCTTPDERDVIAGEVIIWDAKTRRLYKRFSTPGEAESEAVLSGANRRQKWIAWRRAGFTDVSSLTFSPSSEHLAASGVDGVIRIWSPHVASPSGPVVYRLPNALALKSVAYSPDGAYLAAGGCEDGRVWLLDAASGDIVWRESESGHLGLVTQVEFDARGQYLASCSTDGMVIIRNARTGQIMHRLSGHNAAVRCVAFNPDGSRLASGSDDKTIKLWDVSTGKELLTLTRNEAGVADLSFTSTRHATLLSADQEASILRFWAAQ